LLAVALVGCGGGLPPSDAVRVALSPAQTRDVARELGRALDVWDAAIGYRREVAFVFEPHSMAGDTRAGRCICLGEFREVTVWLDHVRTADQLCNVILHELGHAHLGCGDADHQDEPESTMFRRVTAFCGVDSRTIERVHRRKR
jgi:hypothetical protein